MPDLRRIARSLAARFGLVPSQRVIAELRRRGVELGRLRALEVFGADGERMTRFYASEVASLEIWEINPKYEQELRRKFPAATVRIVDSFEQIARTEGPYDLVVIDNPGWSREHFELFPDVYRILSDDAALILNVIPAPMRSTRRRYPTLFTPEHLERRRLSYGTDNPGQIPVAQLAAHYEARSREYGFVPEWHHSVRRRLIWYGIPRAQEVYLLALKLRRAVPESLR